AEQALVQEWEERYEVPVFTSSMIQVEGLRAMGAHRFLGFTFYEERCLVALPATSLTPVSTWPVWRPCPHGRPTGPRRRPSISTSTSSEQCGGTAGCRAYTCTDPAPGG